MSKAYIKLTNENTHEVTIRLLDAGPGPAATLEIRTNAEGGVVGRSGTTERYKCVLVAGNEVTVVIED